MSDALQTAIWLFLAVLSAFVVLVVIPAAATRIWLFFQSRSHNGPITDHVLLLPIEPPNTAHGMEMPDTQAERPTQGIVIAVGPGRVTEMGQRIPPEVRKGDRVTYPSYAGVDHVMDLDGEPKVYRLVRQDEIAYNHGPAEEMS